MVNKPQGTLSEYEALGRRSRRIAYVALFFAGVCTWAVVLLATVASDSRLVPALPFLGGMSLWLTVLAGYAVLRL